LVVNVLPKLHELAQQAGIELPAALGRVDRDTPRGVPVNGKAAPHDGTNDRKA
jgi:hypothetical protein